MSESAAHPPEFETYRQGLTSVRLNEENPWKDAIAKDTETARALLDAAYEKFPWIAQQTSGWFEKGFRKQGAQFADELDAWAKALNEPFGKIAMVNCAYEFDHLGTAFSSIPAHLKMMWHTIFGCTSAVVRLANETVQIRNLDWPIPGMGPATRVFDFTGGKGGHAFQVIGFPCFVGALSGMVPGQYSATINWAPPYWLPDFEYAPALLLRDTFETCATYDEACKKLSETRLSASVFYTVCGLNEGCVIERTPDSAQVRPLTEDYLIQTNHHQAPPLIANNELLEHLRKADFLVETTEARFASTEQGIKNSGIIGQQRSDAEVLAAFNLRETTNCQTIQRMVLRPSSGSIYLETSKEI